MNVNSNLERSKVIVVGAGPVGALAALYAAQRGHDVELYELRSDLRHPSTTPLNFTRSINLALSERGINALRQAGRPQLVDKILSLTLSMKGRMVHSINKNGDLVEQSQAYDIHGRTIYAIDRGDLNKVLLDELEAIPNAHLKFNHKLIGADFKRNKAWFVTTTETPHQKDNEKKEISFDFLLGADGAHSAVRQHLMKVQRIDYSQEYIDTLWCEFQIKPIMIDGAAESGSLVRISADHLHIWPGGDFMFIAIPSLDGSFTCTLFMPSAQFTELEEQPDRIPDFFDAQFPGVTALIPPNELRLSFRNNPHLPLISIKCHPYHYSSSAVLLGDAAHAMVPFFGQGMNAGLEDVRVLFQNIDEYSIDHRSKALEQYTKFRRPDAHAINDLALQNYLEMRASVTSPIYRLRKWLEESLSMYVPKLGWQTKYSRVSFGNERYSEIMYKTERQGNILLAGLIGIVGCPAIVAGMVYWQNWRGLRG